MSKSHVVTKQNLLAAAALIKANGMAKGAGTTTTSTGSPAWIPEGRPSTERHSILAALQRVVGVRKYNSNRGWYVKDGYTGFTNRKALDTLAMNYAFNDSAIGAPVVGIEGYNNAGGVNVDKAVAFLQFAASRTGNDGSVDLSGMKIKRA